MNAPGRNDPCPCGSGRKFKHCCAVRWSAEDAARIRLRTAEGRAVETLLQFALEKWSPSFLYQAWEEFFVWDDVPEEIGETPEFNTMFAPWFTLWYAPDPHHDGTQTDWPTEAVGLHWLATEDPDVSEFERTYIATACASPMSALVVEAVVPGRSVDLKDILTGRRFHALEVSASRTFEPGDVTFARVVTLDGTSVMLGAAPFRIPASWHVRILDWRERLVKRRLMTRHDLVEYDVEIRRLYLDIAAELLNPTPPRLTNTDGDPIEWTTMTYALTAPVDNVIERLTPLATLPGEVHIEEEAETSDAAATTTLSWMKAGNKQHKDWTNTVLGSMRVSSGRLVAEVNSARRAARLKREIAKCLGDGAVLTNEEVTDAAALEQRTQPRAAGTLREIPSPPLTPELLSFQDEAFRRHVESWIDTRVPALGHRTPRQAARSARGRERLEALLTGFEQRAEDAAPNARRHLADLRRALGLEK